MITALAPLGATHKIQLVPEYDGKGNVTVTAILAPKDKKDEVNPRTIQLEGTIEEVEAGLADHLTAAVEKLTAHTATLADLDEQLKKEADEKVEKLKKEKPAPAAAKADGKGGKKGSKEPKDPPLADPKTKTAPLPASGLKPAWAGKKPAPAAPPAEDPPAPAAAEAPGDLGELFNET